MKNILLYGDSFFWGVDATSGSRHRHEDQVGVVCQKELGSDFFVVTEGLRGRTLFGENGAFPERDGLVQFGPIFASHLPLDLVVIMLGTNDLNTKTRHDMGRVAGAVDLYLEKMKFWCDFMNCELPKVLLVAPPDIDESSLEAFQELFSGTAEQVKLLRQTFAQYAVQKGLKFLDASKVVESKDTDGIHLDARENKKLAHAVTEIIQEEIKI